MDLTQTKSRDKRNAFFGAIALALVVSVVAPPVVQAAVQRVRGTVTAKIKDTRGGAINSKGIPAQGLTDIPGSSGAVDVRNFAGGAGVLGAAFCSNLGGNVATAEGGDVVTDILITGTDGEVKVATTALPGHPAYPGALLTARVDANNPNVFVDLSNGLGITAPLTFTASGTDCQVIILGHGVRG